MLCRVFHKAKGDAFSNYGLEYGEDNDIGCSSSLVNDHPMTDGCCEQMVPHQDGNASNTFFNLAVLHCGFLDFPQEVVDATTMAGVDSRGGEDDFGLLLDVGMEDHDLVEGGMANMAGIKFLFP